MPTDISEKGLETILVEYLRDKQGYEQGVSDDYKKQYGVDTERVKRFILSTQKEKTVTTGCFANDNEEVLHTPLGRAHQAWRFGCTPKRFPIYQ